MIFKTNETTELLKNLSTQDFLTFGMHDVAYVRKVQDDDKEAYAVHAADGTPLSVMDSEDEALHVIRHNDLETAILH